MIHRLQYSGALSQAAITSQLYSRVVYLAPDIPSNLLINLRCIFGGHVPRKGLFTG
ncbi:hypothetical protein BDW59DRAFT_155033 [Aspergillus cavernicola]|uniref:Uncharacterized protein n=1 Tax=Aspergillus cavernicola TaxID=176166 RepID=A0ABR4HCC1_9EURO